MKTPTFKYIFKTASMLFSSYLVILIVLAFIFS